VSIGRPIANTSVQVVEPDFGAAPIGVAGELIAGGPGVARGYLGRPDLTAERFVPDPFAAEPGARAYRTGDLVRRRADGAIEFVGRLDQQVKIRGFRIEPAEIEMVLAGHPAVRDAAIVVLEGESPNDRRIAACWTLAESATSPSERALRTYVAARLPDFMVPTVWVSVAEMPLNPNGKIDRKALLKMAGERSKKGGREGYSSARNGLAAILAEVWGRLLGVERVADDDDFFALGGHSLMASQLASRVRSAFGVDLSLSTFFEHSTFTAQTRVIAAARRGKSSEPPLVRLGPGTGRPLSFAQERLWFLDRFDPLSPSYNVPTSVRWRGDFSSARLAAAIGEIVRRHEILRTRFLEVEGQPLQRVEPPTPVAVPQIDLSRLDDERQGRHARILFGRESERPFDLAAGPLLRLVAIRCAEQDHLLLLDVHHIAWDGWSIGVFLHELEALMSPGGGRLAELQIQYSDFAVWHRACLAGENGEQLLSDWGRRLEGLPPAISLPSDRPRPARRSTRGGCVARWLPRDLREHLGRFSRENGATPFVTLFAALAVLLHRASGEVDFAIGTPVSNRNLEALEGLIGFFVNTLALRADLGGEPSFSQCVERARSEALWAFDRQDLPFERLVEAHSPERSSSYTPVFQVMLAVSHLAPLPERIGEARLAAFDLDATPAKFDLGLSVGDPLADASWVWDYSCDLFDSTTAERLAGWFETLLAAAIAEPDRRVGDLAWLNAEERRQVAAWSRREAGSDDDLFATVWARAVAASPHGAALIDAGTGEVLDYAGLAVRSRRFARWLRRRGVGPEVRVGVSIPRSVEAIVAVLAIVEAGGAFVPIDPTYPDDRRALLAERGGCSIVLGGGEERLADGERSGPLGVATPPEAMAYVSFTSGSTGRPKGVVIAHRSLARYAEAAGRRFGIGPGDRTLQLASLSFDTSVEEIFCTLAHGAALVLRDRESASSVDHLYRLCAHWGVTGLHPATAFWHEMAMAPESPPPSLRRIVIGGERLLAERLETWWRTKGDAIPLVNSYGPTEATVSATLWEIDPQAPRERGVSIGVPMPGTVVRVLDRALLPVPPGVVGELALGGDGVARGYLDQPGETAAKFVPDAESVHPGARLFRTRDLVRFSSTGLLMFVGRADSQVKIRGFRVEPGEVEVALSRQVGVRNAAVIASASASGSSRLVGFVALAPGAKLESVSAALRRELPEFLVPTTWVELDELPLLPNGKVDRRVLQAPVETARRDGAGRPAQTPIEQVVVAIWCDLLERSGVGLDESFFDLGGHSLLAIRLIARLRAAFGVELPVRRLFDSPTVAALAAAVAELRAAAEGLPVLPPLARAPRDVILPLSFAQERLWFLDRLEPESAAYNLPVSLRLRGALEPAALAAAFGGLSLRHEILRTRYMDADATPSQVVDPPSPFALRRVALGGLVPESARREALRLASAEAIRPFDLQCGPVLRAALVALDATDHVLLLNVHHIAADGWSYGVIARELSVLYEAALAGRPANLEALPVQYADFAAWQRSWLQGEALAGQLGYWRATLAGAEALLDLPTDRIRPPVRDLRGARVPLRLAAGAAEALRRGARTAGATPFMFLLAAFQTVLGRTAGCDDPVIGAPIANRRGAELEGLVGFFVNSLALRGDLGGRPGFGALVERVRDQVLGAFAHQDLPFERLVEALAPVRSLAHTPIFQVMFAFQSGTLASLDLVGVEAADFAFETASAKFDLTLDFQDDGSDLSGCLEYSTALFDRTTVERLGERFLALLAAGFAEPERDVWELPWISEREAGELVALGRGPEVAFGGARWPEGAIGEQTASAPDRVALAFGDAQLSYGELARRAGALAARLVASGVGPDRVVGLYVERSLEMAIGALGILLSGGAYLPLDPSFPIDRLRLMLADSGAVAWVAPSHLASDALPSTLPRVDLATAGDGELRSKRPFAAAPDNLAYVLFTSGSSGRPKGVSVPRGALDNLLRAFAGELQLDSGDVVAAVTTLSFDIATLELFLPLALGARVLLVPRDTAMDGTDLAALLDAGQVTALQGTPATWRLLLDAGWNGRPGLRMVTGGEALPRDLAEALLTRGQALWNGYGPTETTIYSTVQKIESAPGGSISIGTAIPATRAFVVDRRFGLAPPGVPGELVLGGLGVARGYAGAPHLTAERFVPDAISGGSGARLYRTGDRVRLGAHGKLEFLGRLDGQVKVRGFRVELGEVETALSACVGVRQAVVTVRGSGSAADGRLVGFVVPDEGGTLQVSALRAEIGLRLAPYMVPTDLVILDRLPLTPNGKIDRRRLPEAPSSAKASIEPPRTATEALVAQVWSEVLGVAPIGRDASFFDLGGQSLLAARAVGRLRSRTGSTFELRWIFEAPTVAQLAARLDAAHGRAQEPIDSIEPVARTLPLPASFAQQRLWFLERLRPRNGAYNVYTAFRLEGALDRVRLRAAIAQVCRRHEVLRTVFVERRGEPYQEILPDGGFAWSAFDLAHLSSAAADAQWHRLSQLETSSGFNLANGPLFRALIVRVAPREHRLLLNLHHTITDGSSMAILFGELLAIYRGDGLPNLALQYADYSAWQRRAAGVERLARGVELWRRRLEGWPHLTDLPTDRPRLGSDLSAGAAIPLSWTAAQVDRLRAVGRAAQATLFNVLLTAWQSVLARFSGQTRLAIGTPIEDRPHPDLEGLIGFFVNTVVLRCDVREECGFEQLLAATKAEAVSAQELADTPYTKVVEALRRGERAGSAGDLFSLLFAFQPPPKAAEPPRGLVVEPLPLAGRTAKFEVTLSVGETVSGGLVGEIELATSLFDPTTIARLAGSFMAFLDLAASGEPRSVWDWELVPAAERWQITGEWNDRDVAPSAPIGLAEHFERAAERWPDGVAVESDSEQLTYGELDRRAKRLAERFLSLGIGPDQVVAIGLERSISWVVAILATLEAGGAFLALDPRLPAARQAFLLAEGKAVLGVAAGADRALFSTFPGPVIDPSSEPNGLALAADRRPARHRSNPEGLAYVVFTSGSTGKPKAVMVSDRAAVNHMTWLQRSFPLQRQDALLVKTPTIFDASIWEVFCPLFRGARLVLAPAGAHRDPTLLVDLIAERQATLFQAVPTLLDLVVEQPRLASCRSLRRVFSGGEALPSRIVVRLHQSLPDVEVVNLYGPTEATIDATFTRVDREETRPVVPIGRPIDNVAARVLDLRGVPVPIGVTGDLLLGGAALARGYLGRPELTAERFVPDAVGATFGARLYRTGDRARFLADGRLEFLGRGDRQVKLRGMRIELSEIESVLAADSAVAQAVVSLRGEGSRAAIAAHLVPAAGRTIDLPEVAGRLREVLPEYMVPTLFAVVDRFPLLPNGKVDHRALSEPEPLRAAAARKVAARGPFEALVAEIWRELLGGEEPGVHDDFFVVGGHSLAAARLVARLRDVTGVELQLADVFDRPKLEEIAAAVAAASGSTQGPKQRIPRTDRIGDLPTSSAQERLLFLESLQPGGGAYVVPVSVRLVGPLDVAPLGAALEHLERRHEILRTRYPVSVRGQVQRVEDGPGVRLATIDLAAVPTTLEAVARRLDERGFDLERGPVWRAVLLRISPVAHLLALSFHHVAFDGWSTGIVLGEIQALYSAARARRPSPLAPPPLQYGDFAVWQRGTSEEASFAVKLAAERERLSGLPRAISMPFDRPRPAVQRFVGSDLSGVLPGAIVEQAREVGREEGATLFMVLLAAFQTLLGRLAGQRDVAVGTPIAGRGRTELEGLVGLFTNTLVLRARFAEATSFRSLLAAVRRDALEAFARQDLPFEKLVEALQPGRDLSVSPLFQIFFTLLNAPRPAIEIEGLSFEVPRIPGSTARFDLTLEAAEEGRELAYRFEYRRDLFDPASVARLAQQLGSLLEAASAAPSAALEDLPLLGAVERHLLALEWNDALRPRATELSIGELFVEVAARQPEAMAVACGGEEISYRDLERRTRRIASALARRGIGPDVLVVLSLPRSLDLVVALLAIVRSGGSYLPIDPGYPEERTRLMIADSGARFAITSRALAGRFGAGCDALYLDLLEAAGGEAGPPIRDLLPDQLAYVMYTSGSTGRPKGVMVPQRSVLNFFAGMDDLLGTAPGIWLSVTSVSFDISVLELLWTLTRGFGVVVQVEPTALTAGPLPRVRDLEFSLFFFASDEDQSTENRYRLLFDAARFADTSGFAAVWTPERHFHAFGGQFPNPAVTGAALAAITERIEIRAGSVVLPLHHPVRVAEEWSMVDNMSGGRVGISFASGWHPDDFIFAPEKFAERKEIMFEGIDQVRRLWRGESLAWPGGAGRETEVAIRPRPVRRELPVWVTAAGSPETFRRAGEIGANLLTHLLGQDLATLTANIAVYRAAWQGREGQTSGRVSLMIHTFVGAEVDAVRETVRSPFKSYLKSSAGLLRSQAAGLGGAEAAGRVTEEDEETILDRAFERYFATSCLFGSPESCLAMVESLRAAGVDEIACLIDFGVAEDQVLSALENLARLKGLALRPVEAESLAVHVERRRVTHLQCTPSMANLLAWEPASAAALGRVRRFLVGGEALAPALADRLVAVVGGAVHNMYGPTETTIWSSTDRVIAGAPVTLGRPIANTRISIVDPLGRPAPVGVPGELSIGGSGVVRGYLDRPDLTAERFLPDAAGAEPGARLYRTGDLARYRPDGRIEFLGRTDNQVKLRGHRIELGEIEAALAGHPSVREAVVVLREDRPGDRRLVGYFTSASTVAPTGAELRAYLGRDLPASMVPSAIVALEHFPLTPNRKIDRRALPLPEQAETATADFVEPRTELEKLIAGLFADLLGRDRVGRHDDFFDLGGHSLLATQLLLRLREATGREFPLRMIFEAPTVGGLAERVRAESETTAVGRPILATVSRRDSHPLSFSQQRLWVLEHLGGGGWAYNDHLAVELSGALDVPALRAAFESVVARHESLRTRFVEVLGRPLQIVEPRRRLPLPVVDLTGVAADLTAAVVAGIVQAEARYSFRLEQLPLLRLTLIRTASDRHALALSVHHIIWDGWSMSIFLADLAAFYNAARAGLPSPLAALEVQYIDYAEWQRDWLTGPALAGMLDFWRRELEGAPVALDLPTDRPRPLVQTLRGTRHPFALGAELSADLRRLARREGATLFMVLLSAFQTQIGHLAGQKDLVVGTDVANRSSVATEKMIGFFVNQVVLRARLDGDPTFRDLLGRTRETALAALAHQDLPFDQLVSALQLDRDLSRTPIFQVKFVLQTAPRASETLDGLELRHLDLDWGSAKFDLLLNIEESDGELSGSLEYNADLFDAATAHGLADGYRTLLERVVADPEQKLEGLGAAAAEVSLRHIARHRGERERQSREKLRGLRRKSAFMIPESVGVSTPEATGE
jgi:natural product biosynthesis luciferase-like monooxygenase protein/amino acid adenylation domain-containing protein